MREEVLDDAVVNALRTLTPTPKDAEKLRQDWLAWLEDTERADLLTSYEVRIAEVGCRLDRLTDLLLDGAIDREEHAERRRTLTLERQELEEAHRRAAAERVSPEQIEKFLELLTSLTALHGLANPTEKRALVKNAFSNRRVVEKRVDLQASNWLVERDFAKLSPMVTQDDTLLELLSAHAL